MTNNQKNMMLFKVINRLQLRDGVLMCKKPSGRSLQKAHYKQGDLDGACGAYSISIVLNILGVFEADNLYSDSDSEKVDNRKAEWRLINALNEQGLYCDGLDSSEIQEILSENYSKYVTTQCAIGIYFPTQNLLSDAEVTICKYKWLIINVNAFVLG